MRVPDESKPLKCNENATNSPDKNHEESRSSTPLNTNEKIGPAFERIKIARAKERRACVILGKNLIKKFMRISFKKLLFIQA